MNILPPLCYKGMNQEVYLLTVTGSAGVPHIVLPVWIDCFDFANRAELLGIGRWANRRTLPLNSARELGPVLVDVVLGDRHSESMRRRAEELAAVCGRDGGGRVVAARTIMDEV